MIVGHFRGLLRRLPLLGCLPGAGVATVAKCGKMPDISAFFARFPGPCRGLMLYPGFTPYRAEIYAITETAPKRSIFRFKAGEPMKCGGVQQTGVKWLCGHSRGVVRGVIVCGTPSDSGKTGLFGRVLYRPKMPRYSDRRHKQGRPGKPGRAARRASFRASSPPGFRQRKSGPDSPRRYLIIYPYKPYNMGR